MLLKRSKPICERQIRTYARSLQTVILNKLEYIFNNFNCKIKLISTISVKNSFKQLNIGLTNKEID